MSPDSSYIYFDRKIHIHALKDLLIVQDPNRKSNASNKQWKYRHSQNNLFAACVRSEMPTREDKKRGISCLR